MNTNANNNINNNINNNGAPVLENASGSPVIPNNSVANTNPVSNNPVVPPAQIPQAQVPPIQTSQAQVPPIQTSQAQVPPVQMPQAQVPPVQMPQAQVPQVQMPQAQVPPVQTQQVQTSPAQTNADSIIPIQNNKKDKDDNSNKLNDAEKEYEGKKRFPLTIVILIIVLSGVAIFYYFFWITPERVFDNAFNDIFNSVADVLQYVENSEHKNMGINVKTVLTTSGPSTIEDDSLDFINGMKVNLDSDVDIEKLDLGVKFYSDLSSLVKTTTNSETANNQNGMEYGENLDVNIDYVSDKFYVKTDDKSALVDLGDSVDLDKYSINYSRLNDAVDVFGAMKDQVLELGSEDILEKSITTKKVNNQTALAIKVNVKLNQEQISDIYSVGFTNLYNDNDFIKKFANVLSVTESEAKATLDRIIKREVVTSDIDINLYMNLANTKLIGLDILVDNYYFELSYLNGYYYIDVIIYDDEHKNKLLDVYASYDNYYGLLDVNGVVTLEDETCLYVDVEYERKTSENSLHIAGNKLDFMFYGEDKSNPGNKASKPFAILNCTLDIDYDKENISLTNPDSAVELTDLDGEEIEQLTYTMKKIIHEYYFVYGRLMLNRLDSNDVDKFIDDSSNKAYEMINNIISNAAGSISYSQLVSLTTDELKDKMNSIKDLSSEQQETAYQSIVSNIKSALSYEEINSLEYDKAKELLNDKLNLLDSKYRDDVYNTITDVMVKELTYEKITSMTLEEEKALVNKAGLLPSSNQSTIYNHIIDEIKGNVTYEQILKMTLDEEKALLSKVNELPNDYKNSAYKEITNIVTSGIKYDEIVKMSNDEINTLMSKINELPSSNQKTVLAKVAEVIDKKVTYAYMLDLSIDDEKTLLAKVELLPNKSTIYDNIGKAVCNGLTAKEMATLKEAKIVELLNKVKLLPSSTQSTINDQIVKASQELMNNMDKYNTNVDELLPKVCKLDKSVIERIMTGLSNSCS